MYKQSPIDIIKRYRYKLGADALDVAKVALYKPGKTIPPTEGMHGNYAVGEALKPGAEGKLPISKLGTPVFADVILHEDEDEENGVQLISCLVTVTQTKNIVKTSVAGRNGTDKEYMSDGDYVVKLSGKVTRNFENNYPDTEINRLLQLLRSNKSLRVVSKYLLRFEIYKLTVDSYTMAQQAGMQNQQGFEINCVSDIPLILEQA